MSEDDALYLAEMVEAADKIESYIAGLDEETFLRSQMVADAVALNLLVLGEAANRASAGLRTMDDSFPWADLAGLRNRIAHGYAHVDQRIVWQILTSDLPGLRSRLTRLQELLKDR